MPIGQGYSNGEPQSTVQTARECMIEAASMLFDDIKLLQRLRESLFLTAPQAITLKTMQKFETTDLQAEDILRLKLQEVDITDFWPTFVSDSQYLNTKQLLAGGGGMGSGHMNIPLMEVDRINITEEHWVHEQVAKMPNIKTYCRIKPTTEIYPDYEATKDTLHLRVPEVIRDVSTVNKSHTSINHAFHFDYIFSIDTSQEDVFNKAAVDIVQGFLLGYNGTIFAYGQTGTGKTYTVEGSAKTYSQRGLEPRALSMIYQALEKRQDEEIQVYISYMEIYQEVGYDLLNSGARMQSCVTHFPKVTVLEGPSGSWVIRNLSMHLAASEEVAQSLLLQGEANRKVAATTVHDRSSRSHAVFTIQLTAKNPDSDTFVRSKLHLVDLAGSERVSKTGVYGQQLSEAKSINLSLHHLESVIVALQQETISDTKLPGLRSNANRSQPSLLQRPTSADGYRTSKHVPYRNSLLTMVLRDSLGGNCLTAMIATISLEFENLGETISTCRFAGRVACIANSVSRNEQLDEKTLIRRLRKRVAELESELNCLKMEKEQSGEVAEGAVSRLSHAEKMRCAQVIQEYLSGRITDPVLAGITDPYKFRECLRILRKLVINGYFGSSATNPSNNALSSADQSQPDQSFLNQSEPDLSAFRQEKHDDSNIGLDESFLSRSMQKTKQERSEPLSPRASQRLQTETSSYVQNKSKQSGWEQPETKEPKTLSEMLNAASRPEKYKSPFEKKRVKDIKRLNEKLAKMKAESEQQKKEVTDVKVSLAEQELDLMERSIRAKLDVTRAQVNDQHAFIQQLRVTEADLETLEQEKLVEKQLMRRQMKFEKKLEDAKERLAQLRNHVVEQSENGKKKEASLMEKFGQFKKRDGSLNTRQVFDMLKNEEIKQTKTQVQIDREKLFMTSRQLEVKEAATRQKLQELKDMMRQSQIGYQVTINDESVCDVPERDLTDKRIPGKGDNTLQFMNGYSLDERDHEINITFVKEKAPDGSKLKLEMNGIIANGCPENEKRPSSSLSVRSTKSNIPSSEFYAKRKKEKDPDARWESYSRPGTSDDNKAGPQPHQKASKSNREKDGVFSHTDSKLQGGSSDKTSVEYTHKSPKSKVDILILNELEVTEKSLIQGTKSDSENRVLRTRSDSVEKNSKSWTQSRENDPVSDSKLTETSTTDELKVETLDEKVKKIEDELIENNKRFELPASEFDLKTKENSQLHQTYMPSEYVHNMNTGDKFDGRKMDLKSKNFDAALSAMLNNEKTNMLTMQADYDRYAHSNLPKRSSPARSKHRSHHEHRSKGQEKSHQTSTLTSGGVWGPDAKNSPISEKIRKYLHSPEKERKFLQEKHKSSMTGTRPRSLEDLSRVSEGTYSAPSGFEIEEETPQKITALEDKEREISFMNRAQAERDRVARIRQAQQAAETIQKAWKRYIARKVH
ncbi:hypothetical protein CHS0354_040846 [Potamilus streckersoni]|uniref:Kinesin motor domain-containing protein n=1 Tax=Potamilus streckersoni TaxID=2493646 RepID=A0AAE0SLS6_9BIVA|nr:hypothetical protein CHS0354_040846 [Potamilus streckersoni]